MEGRRLLLTIPFRWLLPSNFLVFNLLFTASSVRAVIYESIQWSPQNLKFHFTTEEFHNNQSYYKLSVLTTSSIYFVCPNPTTIFGVTKMSIPKEELNENLWIVDKKSFETCNIDRNNTENKLLKQCIWNSLYNRRPFRKIVFQRYSGTMSGLQFIPGHEYYFIATSNGLENSLNNTSGGHCRNKDKGVSMRVIFYICKNKSDPNCNQTDFAFGQLRSGSTKTTSTTTTSAPPVALPSTESSSVIVTSTVQPSTPATTSESSQGPKNQARIGSSDNDDKDTWLMIAVFFIVLCAVLVLVLAAIVCTRHGNQNRYEKHDIGKEKKGMAAQNRYLNEPPGHLNPVYRESQAITADDDCEKRGTFNLPFSEEETAHDSEDLVDENTNNIIIIINKKVPSENDEI